MRMLTLTAAVIFAACALAQESATKEKEQPQAQQNQTQKDPQTAQPQAQQDEKPRTTEMVLKKLHKANLREIQLGKLAMERAESEEVKNFGQTLVTEHQKADEKVMALAKEHKVDLPKMDEALKKAAEQADADAKALEDARGAKARELEAKGKTKDAHDAAIERLQSLSGAEFDEEFSQHMIKDHENTIAFLDRVKADENVAKLHGLVNELRPGIQKHAQVAKNLSTKLDKTAKAQTRQN